MKEKEVKTIYQKNGRTYSVRISRSRIFNPQEWNKFYSALREYNKPLFDCLINTGGRISEILNLKKKDFDPKNNTLNLRITKSRNPFSTGNPRLIKISSQYSKRLEKYLQYKELEDYLFPGKKNNKHLSPQTVNQLLKRKLKEIGIVDWYNFSVHNIRKTTECWLNFLGKNHLILLKHFGHNEATALKHYLTTETYDSNYKFKCRQIMGDLYI